MDVSTPDRETLAAIGRACICHQTRMTAHAVTRAYNKVLAKHGMEVTQFNILAMLAYDETPSVTALADALALDRTTMTRNLKRLAAMGFVAVSAGSGRAMRPALTLAGRERLAAAVPTWEREHSRLEAAVGPALWRETRDGLRAIRKRLKQVEA